MPSWLATHLAPEERIEAVEARLCHLPENQFDATVGRAEFLGIIDGLPYGLNPRNGFFRGNTFYHPELAFRLAVAEALRRFASQEGAQTERGIREDINGPLTLIARFQAQSQQGTIGGYAAFFEYGGRTYQLLAYTPAQLFAESSAYFKTSSRALRYSPKPQY